MNEKKNQLSTLFIEVIIIFFLQCWAAAVSLSCQSSFAKDSSTCDG